MLKQGDLKTSWKALKSRLAAAMKTSENPFRLAVVSTSVEDQPRARYVVLRHMDEHLNLFFFTDLRSSKISQLSTNPRVSLLLFDPVDKIQVIVEGSARVYHQCDLTRKFWDNIPGALRKPYSPIARPGIEIQSPDDAHKWPESITDEYFAVIQVSPENFEVLEINGLAHYRAKFSKDNGWQGAWQAP